MADAVLHWSIRPPGIDLNAYFPSSGSLYYESLYWPQSMVAAPVLAATGNPVLAFHLSYLFWWAFSGLCLRWLLQELGMGRTSANLGGLVFTILPYRTGYVVEFNMQLCFGLPLFLLFVMRWSKSNRPRDAAFASIALCLQAASELYQAVFLCLCMPFVVLALFRGRWRSWFSSRQFWLSATVASLVALAFVFALFSPYLGQLGHSVMRPLREVAKHELEPFSYLASREHMRWSLLPQLRVKQDEICVYPTLAVLLVALGGAVARFLTKQFRFGAPRIERILRILRVTTLVAFLAITLVGIVNRSLDGVETVYAGLPVVIALLSLVIPAISRFRNDTDRFLDGLCGAAVFAFLMSLGPYLMVKDTSWSIKSPLFHSLYHATSILKGFRVVSRFGIVVLLFLVVEMAAVWDRFLRAHAGKRGVLPAFARLSWIPFLVLVVFESVPKPLSTPREGTPLPLPFLDDLRKTTGNPLVLAIIPGMNRDFDAMNMFRIAGADPDRLLVMSWGGAWPKFTRLAQRNYERLPYRPGGFHRQFASIWPECFLLLDRVDLPEALDLQTRKAILNSIKQIADPIHSDERYTLYRFHPLPPNDVVERWVRADFLKARSIARFRIVPSSFPGEDVRDAADATRVTLSLNRLPVATLEVEEEGCDCEVRLPDIPPAPVDPFCILFESNRPISIESFRLLPLEETMESRR